MVVEVDLVLTHQHVVVLAGIELGVEIVGLQVILDRVLHELIVLEVLVLHDQVQLQIPCYSVRLALTLAFLSSLIFEVQMTLAAFPHCDLDELC